MTPFGGTNQKVLITGPGGSPYAFQTQEFGNISGFPRTLKSLERADHFVMAFSGSTVPHSIQVDLTHDSEYTVMKARLRKTSRV